MSLPPLSSGSTHRRSFLRTAGNGIGAVGAVSLLGSATPALGASGPVQPAMYRNSDSLKRQSLAGESAPPPFAIRVLSRMGFGPQPGDVAAFNALANTDSLRLSRYVEQQLNPSGINDSLLEQKLAASDFFTLDKSRAQLWSDHSQRDDDWEYRMRPLFETTRAVYLRARYSRRQLAEVLADFWHAHFNVHGYHFDVGPAFVHYDQEVIRGNMLGNFRQMLEAVTISNAMMYYLNQVSSRADGPNENFPREMLELHALGARNSAGFLDESQVPEYPDGLKQQYTEADVKAFARCLTGWTVKNGWQWPRHPNDTDDGSFWFRDEWHDTSPKRVLGVAITGQGIDEARQVFDLLARHPGVARFICEKLCRRLVSDNPPAELIDAAAEVFYQQRNAPDQLAQVVRTILLSDAFSTTWGEKIKRPFETVVSALRAFDADLSLRFDDVSENWNTDSFWFDSNNFLWQSEHTGHFPFDWPPPNGYPDYKEDWAGSTPLVMTWRVINGAINHWADGNKLRIAITEPTLAALPDPADHTAEKLTDFWLDRVLGYRPAASRAALIAFMAQGGPTDQPLVDISMDSWSPDDPAAYVAARLRMLAAMVAMTPEFLLR